MPYKPLLILLFCIIALGCGDEQMSTQSQSDGTTQSLSPGQVWTYQTRPAENDSRIVICRVESDPKLGEIVHIHINGLKLKSPQAPNGFAKLIHHMPYSGDELRKHVLTLESSDESLPDFQEGYDIWREAFDQGEAGVWSVPVSEAIDVMESSMNP